MQMERCRPYAKTAGSWCFPLRPTNLLETSAPGGYFPQELWTSMGFLVFYDAQRACGGAMCLFARGQPVPSARTASQRAQVGNCIHINMIGAVSIATLLKLPELGERAPARRPPGQCAPVAAQSSAPAGPSTPATSSGSRANPGRVQRILSRVGSESTSPRAGPLAKRRRLASKTKADDTNDGQ